MSRDIVDLDDVVVEEREELARRRKQAGFVPPDATSANREYRPEDVTDPVGLAVSGGGVRSAAFSLGVIQSLYEHGLLRFCDYLSTVSGGSYVGGFLTSLAVHGHSELQWTKRVAPAAQQLLSNAAVPQTGHNGTATAAASAPAAQPAVQQPATPSAQYIRRRTDALAERITIEPDAQHRQPHYVRRLVLGSSYLDRPLLFFSHWLPGFLQYNLIAIGSLLSVCALAAWIFRTLDTDSWQRLLQALGFGDDVSRAFFPTVAVFTIWILVLVYRGLRALFSNRAGTSSVAPYLTLLLLVTALVSAVSLIGVGDVNTKFLLERFNIQLNPDFVSQLQSIAHWALYTVLAVAIIPYLSPASLVRSGATNASWRDRMFFKFMTHAMLWGVPLVIFGLLASENISQFNRQRDDQYLLSSPTIKDWPAFVARLERAPTKDELGNSDVIDCNQELWKRLNDSHYPANLQALAKLDPSLPNGEVRELADPKDPTRRGTAAEALRLVALESDHRAEVIRHTSWLPRLGSAVAWVFGDRIDNQFEELLASDWKYQSDRNLAVALLNDQLLRCDFSSAFEKLATCLGRKDGTAKPPPGFRGDPARFLEAYENARRIEAQVTRNDATDFAGTAKRPVVPGDADKSSKAADTAGQSPSQLFEYVDRFRQLRLLEAVIDYHLAVNPERLTWSADLHAQRDRLQQEIHRMQHPVEMLSGDDEISEASKEAKLRELEKAHFELLHAFYGPSLMHPFDNVFARVVIGPDQQFRLTLFFAALGVFLIAGLCIDLNSTSLHRFYRDRLASVWLVGAHDKVPHLTDLKTSEKGAPYLLVNCALSFLRSDSQDREATAPFLFSYRACGSSRVGFAPSSRYEGGTFDLADAMAISGGAVTPTATRNLAVQALMWLMNWRLGRWMANPAVRALLDQPASYRRIWKRPQALHLLLSWLLVPERDRDFHFVSDGGLHENLGIEPLIERRCRLIIAIDAGADPKEQFDDLVKLLFRLRLHHGVEIEALNENSPLVERNRDAVVARSPLGRLFARDEQGRPTADGCCRSHFVLARIRYPDQDLPAWLVYIRPGYDGDESEALRRFRTQNASFPNDSTDDQFFTFARFEAYRLLGEHIGHSLCAQLTPNLVEIDSIPKLLERVEQHAASATIVAANTLASTGAPTPIGPCDAAAGSDARYVKFVDNLSPLTNPPVAAGAGADKTASPYREKDAVEQKAEVTPPAGNGAGAGNGLPSGGGEASAAAARANGVAAPEAPASGGGASTGSGTENGNGAPAATSALAANGSGASDRWSIKDASRMARREKRREQLLQEIEASVDEIVASPQKRATTATKRLENSFHQLWKLDPDRALCELQKH